MLKIKNKSPVIRWLYLFVIIEVFFTFSLEAADTKNLENRIKELESENFRLRQEGAMEAEAAKLLGQKLLKAYEEKVVIEDELKEAKEKTKSLEDELARTRKLMEDEVLTYRKKIGAIQEELNSFKKKMAFLSKEDKAKTALEELEKENKALKKSLARNEEDLARELSEINMLKEEVKAKTQALAQSEEKKGKTRVELEALEKENKALKEKLSRNEEDLARELSEINMLKEEVKAKTQALAQSKEKVEEPKSTISSAEPTPTESGKIMRVSKEFSFVIIEFNNPGELTVGKIFSVFRGENKIGEVEISKIRDKYVFAKILNMVANEEIKEGDSIK